jgi:hypothetical protein
MEMYAVGSRIEAEQLVDDDLEALMFMLGREEEERGKKKVGESRYRLMRRMMAGL